MARIWQSARPARSSASRAVLTSSALRVKERERKSTPPTWPAHDFHFAIASWSSCVRQGSEFRALEKCTVSSRPSRVASLLHRQIRLPSSGPGPSTVRNAELRSIPVNCAEATPPWSSSVAAV